MNQKWNRLKETIRYVGTNVILKAFLRKRRNCTPQRRIVIKKNSKEERKLYASGDILM